MKRRILSLLLALAVCCSAVALAEEQPAETEDTPGAGETTVDGTEGEAQQPEENSPEEESLPSPAGPDLSPAEGESPIDYKPDAVGTVSFENLERRMRENNLNVLTLQENISCLEVIDYEDMKEDLREAMHNISKLQWGLVQMGQSESFTYVQLSQSYDSIREQFDALQNGEIQEDNAGAIRQLRNLQDQIVMAGETLYTSIWELEQQESSLQRQLASLNRTVEEMELRYQLGQISALQLEEVRGGRTSLVSGLQTLQMNIRSMKTQLELLIGAEQTGEISLSAIPSVTNAQLEKMDLEADLTAAKAKSYDLYSAEIALRDAKEDYLDELPHYGIDSTRYEKEILDHTWNAAQHTYAGTVQDYELRFRTLYAQVQDYRQILEASRVSLNVQKSSLASAELKYQQGTLSKNKFLDAQDELKKAEEAVQTAANNLFSSYNTYCWAVQHGILN